MGQPLALPSLQQPLGLLLPLCAALTLTDWGSEKTTGPEPVEPVDSVAPVIVSFTGPVGQVALGGVITLGLVARDSVQVKGATLSFSGAFEASQWFDFEKDWNGVPLVFTVQIPFDAAPELPVIVTITVEDGAGNTAEARGAAWPNLLRLPDERLYIGPLSQSSRTLEQVIYSPETNTFASINRLRAAGEWQFSASPSGRFMLGSTVYDASLDSVASVRTQDWKEEDGSSFPAALSADGTAAYLTTHYGYEKVRLADGFLLEQVKLGMRPRHLIATADGTRLIAVGESAVMVIDLR